MEKTTDSSLLECDEVAVSLHSAIKNKPTNFRAEFGRGWKGRAVTLDQLRQHVSEGKAFIPAVMTSEHRSSSAFSHADLAVVDIDHGMTLDAFMSHELAAHAAWIYTTCSHGSADGAHRFRILFRLPHRIASAHQYTQLLNALARELGGDPSCTDPCRLFYGNDSALHPLFQPDVALPAELVATLCSKHSLESAVHSQVDHDYDDRTIAQAIHVLEHVLDPTVDGERDRFVKVTAAASSAGDALLAAWQDWASRCHHTTGHRKRQGSEKFYASFRSTRTSLTTLFYLASQQDPDWRHSLPEEIRVSGAESFFSQTGVAGYDHEDFLAEDPYEAPSVDGLNDRTRSLFDLHEPIAPGLVQRGAAELAQPDADRHLASNGAAPDAVEFDEDDDFDFTDDDLDPPVTPGARRQGAKQGMPEAVVVKNLIAKHYPGLRLNLLTQRYEYIRNDATCEIEDITTIYITIALELERFPPKTAVTDAARYMGRLNAYHPVKDYLNRCADSVTPWPHFDEVASTILGLPEDSARNPTLGSGLSLGDVVLRRFLIAAVARIFEPGCPVQWMPILVGDQAIGKSRFLELLTPPVPADTQTHPWTSFNQVPLHNLAEKPHQLHCGWIVVLDETERHFKRDQVEIFKNLISISIDRSARKYENELDFPRAFVLVGATNTDTFLKDPTGNRRFLPIYVTGKSPQGDSTHQPMVDLACLEQHRDAIWSAAVHAYREARAQGLQPWHFMSHELAEIKSYMDGFFADNPYISKLAQATPSAFAAKCNGAVATHEGRDYVRMHTVYDYLDIAIDRHASASLPISDALKMLGYSNRRICLDGKQTRVWFFPERSSPNPSMAGSLDHPPQDWV